MGAWAVRCGVGGGGDMCEGFRNGGCGVVRVGELGVSLYAMRDEEELGCAEEKEEDGCGLLALES